MSPAKRRIPSTDSTLTHALLYRRVSGAEHQKKGLSLETQREAIATYVSAQAGWVVAGEYQDVMKGTRDDRREYQHLLADARRLAAEGRRAAVVVMRLDRLGRNLLEQVRARNELKNLGADTHAIKEGGLLSNLQAHILMCAAEEEVERLGLRVAEVRGHLAVEGWRFGGPTPFGYRPRLGTDEDVRVGLARPLASGGVSPVLELDPVTAPIVAEIFERVADGASIRSVSTTWLSQLPSEQRGGRMWPHRSVQNLLQSPTYVARPEVGVVDVLARPRGRWVPLVTDDLWLRVQQRLAGHQKLHHQATGRYLLTGFLRCDRCGCRMVATNHRKDRKIYRCTGHAMGSNAPIAGCQQNLSLRAADQAVMHRVDELLATFAEPNRWPGLHAASEKRTKLSAHDDPARQLAQLERAQATALRDLANAARILFNEQADEHDRRAAKALRDEAVASIDAIELARAKVMASKTEVAKLPSLEKVLTDTGGWLNVVRGADIRRQRDVLDTLIAEVRPRRVAWGKYEADITWTELGAWLDDLHAQTAQQAA